MAKANIFSCGKGLFRRVPGGTIFARIGKRTRSTATTSVDDAVVWRAEQLRHLHLHGDLPHKLRTTLRQLCEDYVKHLEVEGAKSSHGVRLLLYKLCDHEVFKDRLASSVTTDDFRRYRKVRKEKGGRSRKHLCDITIDSSLKCLRAAYNYGYEGRTPATVATVPKFEISQNNVPRQGFLEIEHIETVRSSLPDSLQPFFMIAYRCGMRRGELLNLRWRQIDFTNEWIELRNGETKNGEGRYVPFLVDMGEWLKRQYGLHQSECPDCEYVFFWHRSDLNRRIPIIRDGRHAGVDATLTMSESKPFSGERVRDVWNAAVKQAGFPELLIHDMRRSALRNMVQLYDIGTTEAMLISGHKSFSVFRRYNIQTTRTLKRTAESINARHAAMRAVNEMMGVQTGHSDEALERLLLEGTIEDIMEYRLGRKKGLGA
jgi:integrase